MKKLWILPVLLLAGSFLFFGCGPAGPSGSPGGELVLFENGQWNSDLGDVMAMWEDGDGDPDGKNEELEKSGSVYTVTDGDFAAFYFENTIDASEYSSLVVELENAGGVEYWSGGQLFFYDDFGWEDTDPESEDFGETVYLAKFGYWSDTVGKNNTTQTFKFNDSTIKQDFPDEAEESLYMDDFLGAFAGFRVKGASDNKPLSVKKVYLTGSAFTYYTVSFDANGGDGEIDSVRVRSGESIMLPGDEDLTAPEDENIDFVFAGWAESASATEADYAAGDEYAPAKTLTLYAVWVDSSTEYTVSFDANGGDGDIADMAANAGTSITLPGGGDLSPPEGDFAFAGWAADKNAAEADYEAGDSYTPTKDITLYAVWKDASVEFPVLYEDGAWLAALGAITEGGGATENKTFEFDGGVNVSGGEYTHVKFTFKTVSYYFGGSLEGNESSSGGHGQGGWVNNQYWGGFDRAADNLSATGGLTGIGHLKKIALGAEGLTNVTRIELIYIEPPPPVSYTVTYKAGEGTGNDIEAEAEEGTEITLLPADTFSAPAGKELFVNWSDGAMQYAAGSQYTVEGNVTFTALWDSADAAYTVTYDLNGGTGTAPDSEEDVAVGTEITLPDDTGFSNGDKVFVGWALDENATEATHAASADYTVTSNVTFFAVWKDAIEPPELPVLYENGVWLAALGTPDINPSNGGNTTVKFMDDSGGLDVSDGTYNSLLVHFSSTPGWFGGGVEGHKADGTTWIDLQVWDGSVLNSSAGTATFAFPDDLVTFRQITLSGTDAMSSIDKIWLDFIEPVVLPDDVLFTVKLVENWNSDVDPPEWYGYQGVINPEWLFDGEAIQNGDEFTLDITFTSDQDITDLKIFLVDNTAAGNWWTSLTGQESIGQVAADTEITVTVTLNATNSASSGDAGANKMGFTTSDEDADGAEPTLSFKSFSLTLEGGSGWTHTHPDQ